MFLGLGGDTLKAWVQWPWKAHSLSCWFRNMNMNMANNQDQQILIQPEAECRFTHTAQEKFRTPPRHPGMAFWASFCWIHWQCALYSFGLLPCLIQWDIAFIHMQCLKPDTWQLPLIAGSCRLVMSGSVWQVIDWYTHASICSFMLAVGFFHSFAWHSNIHFPSVVCFMAGNNSMQLGISTRKDITPAAWNAVLGTAHVELYTCGVVWHLHLQNY